jgi:triosephosphate isomerase (TIM)
MKRICAGNWKMHGSRKEIEEMVEALGKKSFDNTDVLLLLPSPYLHLYKKKSAGVHLGSQNICGFNESEAYTGEVSHTMLRELGAEYVLVGHSERRKHFRDSSKYIAKQGKIALQNGLGVILCVGEDREEREEDKTMQVVYNELESFYDAIRSEKKEWSRVSVAYEPRWAIGTGEVARPRDVEHVVQKIREWMRKQDVEGGRVLYGGSVTLENAAQFLEIEGLDGFLVGGLSYKKDFVKLCELLEEQ